MPRAKKQVSPNARDTDAGAVLRWLERTGTARERDGLARFGIPSTRALGISVGALRARAKQLGKDHALAQALWKSGWYEARLLAAFVDDPAAVTSAQMEAWADDFDSWAVCDTVCFALFDRTPLAWAKVKAWAKARPEFKKRAAFALVWSLSVHDKKAPDRHFLDCLPLLERGALDERDYVKKGVDMALRALGKRNDALRRAALELAQRLCESERGAQSWVGRSTLRELAKRRHGRGSRARG